MLLFLLFCLVIVFFLYEFNVQVVWMHLLNPSLLTGSGPKLCWVCFFGDLLIPDSVCIEIKEQKRTEEQTEREENRREVLEDTANP